MPRLWRLLLLALFLGSSAQAAAPLRDGVYKHLVYVEEAGDLLGMAVRITGGRSPTIIVTSCEGGCFGGGRWPLRVTGQAVSFTTCDPVIGPAACTPIRYVGRFRPEGSLVLSISGEAGSSIVLKRVKRPRPREVEDLACARQNC